MKKKHTDLSPFQDWLVNDQSISQRAASVYASTVRKVLAQVISPTVFSLNQYAEALKTNKSKAQVDNFYSHWRRYAQFMQSTQKIKIAVPSARSKKKKVYSIPGFVWEAYHEIYQYNKMKLDILGTLRFKQLVIPPRSKLYELPNLEKPWIIFQIPKEPIDRILQWSNPIRESSIPLFPEEPMSLTKIPVSNLKSLWREYKRTHL